MNKDMDIDIHLRSFTTSEWARSRARFRDQTRIVADRYSLFKSWDMLQECDLGDDFWSYDMHDLWLAVGHAFYAWKPYVILKSLMSIRDGDLLMYADGGSNFSVGDFNKLDNFVADLKKLAYDTVNVSVDVPRLALTTWRSANYCAADCCTSLLRFFGLDDDDTFTRKFPHYEAGVILIQNTGLNRAFVAEWWNTMRNNVRRLFSDTNHGLAGYTHNSNDQAVLQALLYKNHASVLDSTDLFYGYGYYARCRG